MEEEGNKRKLYYCSVYLCLLNMSQSLRETEDLRGEKLMLGFKAKERHSQQPAV